MIVIWGKPLCGFCDAAKAFCESRHLAYEYKELNVDFTRETILETFPGAKSFPQIVVGGTPIGGFDKLAAYCEDTGYNRTGHSLS